jgi:hypothetical protein
MFQFHIRHKAYGLVDTEGMILDVSSKVTKVTPLVGSIYGGTLLTITGTNFGTKKTDNPVQLSTHGGVGSIDCLVQTINPTQITCRVDPNMRAKVDNTKAEVAVFLKTYEEAKCPGVLCNWVYSKPSPKVTKVTPVFSKDTNQWTVEVTGTGFGSTKNADLQINAVTQPTLTQADTKAVFTITDVKDLVSSAQNLFFPIGLPEAHDLLRAAITLTPKFVSITPNVGTPGSTLIRANVQGVGTLTAKPDFINKKTGASICRSDTIKVLSYGLIECWTKREEWGATALDIQFKHNNAKFDCENTDKTKCQYTQDNTAKKYPKILTMKKKDNTLVFTGENFYTVGYKFTATYNKIAAASVVVNSATEAVATFTGGVPIVTAVEQSREERANLMF